MIPTISSESTDNDHRLGDALAESAATYLRERASDDYKAAREHAQRKLGAPHMSNQPSNSQIAEALHRQLAFFQPERQQALLAKLRKVAVEAMEFFADYNPKLVGSALDGTANDHSAVVLHVFAYTVEEVIFHLQDSNVPYDLHDRRLPRGKSSATTTVPMLSFIAGDTPLEVYVFDYTRGRQAPPCPVSGKPMKRASRQQVIKLLAA